MHKVKCVHLDESASLEMANGAEIKNNTVVPRRMKVFFIFLGTYVLYWWVCRLYVILTACSEICSAKSVLSIFLPFCPRD